MRLLLINPNTTKSMTDTASAAARRVAHPETEIIARTAAIGPESIEGYYDEALAIPGLLAELAEGEKAVADAAIISCFDDTGLDAARSLASIPVVGLCESALAVASFIAPRFAIVTTLERSRLPISHLVQRYGFEGRCTVRAADIPVLSIADKTAEEYGRLKAEIGAALKEDRAEAIILGCAGMADLALDLQMEFSVPVIDGVAAAVKQAEALYGLGLKTSKTGAYASPRPKAYAGMLARFSPGAS